MTLCSNDLTFENFCLGVDAGACVAALIRNEKNSNEQKLALKRAYREALVLCSELKKKQALEPACRKTLVIVRGGQREEASAISLMDHGKKNRRWSARARRWSWAASERRPVPWR